MTPDHDELAELRQRVDCRTVLERAGWKLDAKESSRLAAKYRSGPGRIVIVTHQGKGWFDPLDDKRGDVIALAQYVWGGNLGHARKALRPLAGIEPELMPLHESIEVVPIDGEAMWRQARQLRRGSQAWSYLTDTRCLPTATVMRTVQAGVLREGVYGTAWAQHRGASGEVTGWEMRGPSYKGFSKGGTKTLFRLGNSLSADRVVATEGAIDAMSLASIEGWPDGTLYVSTAGGYGNQTTAALRALLRPGVELVAATDRGIGGELLASRLRVLATECGAEFLRLLPIAEDWNEQIVETRSLGVRT